jgi:DNA-binding NarL/FixJ family response regulator
MNHAKVIKNISPEEYYLSLLAKSTSHIIDNALSSRKRYFLGKAYPDVYLTEREAQCITGLLQHGTMKTIAKHLKLSPRTVEYYIQNVKSKLHCASKMQLLTRIKASDFLKNNLNMEQNATTAKANDKPSLKP